MISEINFRSCIVHFCVFVGLFVAPLTVEAQNSKTVFGVKVKAGGRYDNVRLCVATDAGAKIGPAADLAFYSEFGLTEKMSISFDLPVFRPILFGTAFKMLQFESDASLLFRAPLKGNTDLIYGPTLGISLHYGPDYNSGKSGAARTDSFFAVGPRLGAYVGIDFKRPDKTMNFQLGLQPYVTPLFGINDPANHKGVVVGGTLVGIFRFSK